MSYSEDQLVGKSLGKPTCDRQAARRLTKLFIGPHQGHSPLGKLLGRASCGQRAASCPTKPIIGPCRSINGGLMASIKRLRNTIGYLVNADNYKINTTNPPQNAITGSSFRTRTAGPTIVDDGSNSQRQRLVTSMYYSRFYIVLKGFKVL